MVVAGTFGNVTIIELAPFETVTTTDHSVSSNPAAL